MYICRVKIEVALKSTFQSEEQKAQVNLMYTANWVTQHVATLLKPYKLTNEQYNVLRILRGSNPASMCLKDITGRMINPHCNTTRVVDRLVIKKLVDKQSSETDKRELSIKITDKGLAILKEIDVLFQTNPPRIGLIVHELFLLNELLDKMRNVD